MARRGLVLLGTLLALAVWAQAAHACSCIPRHPAAKLASGTAAFVGTVETREVAPSGGLIYTFRIEKVLKGAITGDRITLGSGLTSCQVSVAVGARLGVVLSGPPAEWSLISCGVEDADALLAASELPAPKGVARFVAAVDHDRTTDAVALAGNGGAAGYGTRLGKPLALAGCGAATATAFLASRGVAVGVRKAPDLVATSVVELDLAFADAVACANGGRTVWVAGPRRDKAVVLAIRDGKVRTVYSGVAAGTATISGTHASFASPGRVDIVTLTTGKVRTVRSAVSFIGLAVSGSRVAGRIVGGGAAVLDLRTGRVESRRDVGALAWLDSRTLLDAAHGTVLDDRLRVVRRVRGVSGTVVAVVAGAAYLADGDRLLRLARGAGRARSFARLPGKVVALTSTTVRATASWHSCEKSAKSP